MTGLPIREDQRLMPHPVGWGPGLNPFSPGSESADVGLTATYYNKRAKISVYNAGSAISRRCSGEGCRTGRYVNLAATQSD